MFMKKIAAFIVVAGLLIGGTALAGQDTTEPKKVGHIYINAQGKVQIHPASGTWENDKTQCGASDFLILSTEIVSQEALKLQMSLILAAKMAGKEVSFFVSGCREWYTGTQTYPMIHGVHIVK